MIVDNRERGNLGKHGFGRALAAGRLTNVEQGKHLLLRKGEPRRQIRVECCGSTIKVIFTGVQVVLAKGLSFKMLPGMNQGRSEADRNGVVSPASREGSRTM